MRLVAGLVAAMLILATQIGSTASAQQSCPTTVTSARVRALPLYGRDLQTPVGELRDKTAANSLNLSVFRCLEAYYVVDVPGLGRALVRKVDVQTNAPSEDDRPICDNSAAVQDPYSQNRSAMGSGGRFCRNP